MDVESKEVVTRMVRLLYVSLFRLLFVTLFCMQRVLPASRLCGCVIEHGIALIVPFLVGIAPWIASFLFGVQIV